MALLRPPEETWPLFKPRLLLCLTATGAARRPGEPQAALGVCDTLLLKAGEEDLVTVPAQFEERCRPLPGETYRRYLFHSRQQGPREPAQAFAAELERQSRACGFGPLRESLVRDQLVLGCWDETVRARLLREDGLSLARAVQICQEAEEGGKRGKHPRRAERCRSAAGRRDPGSRECRTRDSLCTYV